MTSNLDCTLQDFFSFTTEHGECTLQENSGTFISLYNKKNSKFNNSFESLQKCFSSNDRSIPADMTINNTIWMETFQNKSGIKGLGKKMLDVLKNKAIENNIKYIFLYPSKSLGGSNDQDALISLYEKYGFLKLSNCLFTFPNIITFDQNIRTNMFDNDAPYHLMFAEISKLNTSSGIVLNVNYKEKYLKYKQKYLELKNKFAL